MTTTSTPHISKEMLPALYAVAYEFYRNGKYTNGKTLFHLLTIADPFDHRFWIGLGACYQMLKNYQAAITAYSAAAIQSSNDPYIHLHAAECLFHTGDLTRALQALDSSLIIAKETNNHDLLIEKLELLHNTWSALQHGDSHA